MEFFKDFIVFQNFRISSEHFFIVYAKDVTGQSVFSALYTEAVISLIPLNLYIENIIIVEHRKLF